MQQQINTTKKPLNQNKMEKKYFIIEVGEDMHKTILFDIMDKLKEEGHYFVANCTTNANQFDVKRVTEDEFNKFTDYEQSERYV